jgi:hypothetical protein
VRPQGDQDAALDELEDGVRKEERELFAQLALRHHENDERGAYEST